MLFKEIDGQEKIKNYLIKSIIDNKLSQSYIFESAKDGEAYNMAIAFAQSIYCENFNGDACGICDSCKSVVSLNHPDLHIYNPYENKIKRENIDNLIDNVNRKAFYKDKKIFIINEAEKMNLPAANTLLKTLEEPVADIIIILIVKNTSSLLATIKSRCQIIKFRSENLSNIYITEDSIARWNYLELFLKIVNSDTIVIYDLEKYFEKEKDNINMILDLFELFLRDIAYILTNNTSKIINQDRSEDLITVSKKFELKSLSKILDGLQQLKLDVKGNVNYRFIVDNLVFIIQEEIR